MISDLNYLVHASIFNVKIRQRRAQFEIVASQLLVTIVIDVILQLSFRFPICVRYASVSLFRWSHVGVFLLNRKHRVLIFA
jgi:hypothetical protein